MIITARRTARQMYGQLAVRNGASSIIDDDIMPLEYVTMGELVFRFQFLTRGVGTNQTGCALNRNGGPIM